MDQNHETISNYKYSSYSARNTSYMRSNDSPTTSVRTLRILEIKRLRLREVTNYKSYGILSKVFCFQNKKNARFPCIKVKKMEGRATSQKHQGPTSCLEVAPNSHLTSSSLNGSCSGILVLDVSSAMFVKFERK